MNNIYNTSYLFLVKFPIRVDSGNLYSASDTLSNSRLSYYGQASGAHTVGTTSIAIKTSRTSYLPPDIDINHLFGTTKYQVSAGVTQQAGYYQTRIYYVAYGTF